MNGYTCETPLYKRLENLTDQIPQEYRALVLADACNENPHDMERHLTASVSWEVWNSPDWKMRVLNFYIIDIDHNRVFEGSYKQCAAELDRLMSNESGYWYIYDETDPNEAWQSGGDADLAEAADIIEAWGDFTQPAQYCHQMNEMTADGCGNDDLYDYARGG